MKKSLLKTVLLATSMVLVGCTSPTGNTTDTSTDNNQENAETTMINIVTTSFYEYDWLTQVIGDEADNFHITLLNDTGTDMHNYEPTVEDIATITTSDLFIYNGGESETWVDAILTANTELNSLGIIEVLDDNVKMTEVVEGMETEDHDHDDEEDEDHDHDDEEDEDHDHEDDEDEDHVHEDEHVWLSLNNAIIVCEYFAEVLGSLDPENAEIYTANAQSYIVSLESLDAEYEEMLANAARDTIIVADRFPFLYLVSDYNIQYFAAFEGCSTETDASFETIVFLAEKADEYDVNYLIILEDGLESLAQTIVTSSSNSDIEIIELDSMQSVSQEDIDAGITYYSIMESNLEILELVLSE